VGYVSGLRDAAQHVSGAIIPIIRSSRVIEMAAACGTWRFGLTNRRSGVELWVMCPVCGMLQHNGARNMLSEQYS